MAEVVDAAAGVVAAAVAAANSSGFSRPSAQMEPLAARFELRPAG
jgi:hypothetical protein